MLDQGLCGSHLRNTSSIFFAVYHSYSSALFAYLKSKQKLQICVPVTRFVTNKDAMLSRAQLLGLNKVLGCFLRRQMTVQNERMLSFLVLTYSTRSYRIASWTRDVLVFLKLFWCRGPGCNDCSLFFYTQSMLKLVATIGFYTANTTSDADILNTPTNECTEWKNAEFSSMDIIYSVI